MEKTRNKLTTFLPLTTHFDEGRMRKRKEEGNFLSCKAGFLFVNGRFDASWRYVVVKSPGGVRPGIWVKAIPSACWAGLSFHLEGRDEFPSAASFGQPVHVVSNKKGNSVKRDYVRF